MADKILTFNRKTISGPSGTGMVVLKEPAPAHQVVIGGKTYRTVQMPDGNEWLAENLDFAWDGLSVPTEGASMSTDPQAMYYDYDESTYGWNGYKCGLLYNWYAVKYLEDNKSTLIPGWHVPTPDEWNALTNAAGGVYIAGTKLKARNVSWASSWGGTDDYGFSVLPTGFYSLDFYYIDTYGHFWTAVENDEITACSQFFVQGETTSVNYDGKKDQFSVRLVRDAT